MKRIIDLPPIFQTGYNPNAIPIQSFGRKVKKMKLNYQNPFYTTGFDHSLKEYYAPLTFDGTTSVERRDAAMEWQQAAQRQNAQIYEDPKKKDKFGNALDSDWGYHPGSESENKQNDSRESIFRKLVASNPQGANIQEQIFQDIHRKLTQKIALTPYEKMLLVTARAQEQRNAYNSVTARNAEQVEDYRPEQQTAVDPKVAITPAIKTIGNSAPTPGETAEQVKQIIQEKNPQNVDKAINAAKTNVSFTAAAEQPNQTTAVPIPNKQTIPIVPAETGGNDERNEEETGGDDERSEEIPVSPAATAAADTTTANTAASNTFGTAVDDTPHVMTIPMASTSDETQSVLSLEDDIKLAKKFLSALTELPSRRMTPTKSGIQQPLLEERNITIQGLVKDLFKWSEKGLNDLKDWGKSARLSQETQGKLEKAISLINQEYVRRKNPRQRATKNTKE